MSTVSPNLSLSKVEKTVKRSILFMLTSNPQTITVTPTYSFPSGRNGPCTHHRWVHTRLTPGDNTSQGCHITFGCLCICHEHNCRRAIIDSWGIPSSHGTCAILEKARLETSEALYCGTMTWEFIFFDFYCTCKWTQSIWQYCK